MAVPSHDYDRESARTRKAGRTRLAPSLLPARRRRGSFIEPSIGGLEYGRILGLLTIAALSLALTSARAEDKTPDATIKLHAGSPAAPMPPGCAKIVGVLDQNPGLSADEIAKQTSTDVETVRSCTDLWRRRRMSGPWSMALYADGSRDA